MMQATTPFDYSTITAAIKEAMNYSETQQAANLIINSKGIREIDLVKRFQTYISDPDGVYPLQLKLNVFQTMAALILSTEKNRFMRHVVTRLPVFLSKYGQNIIDSVEMSKRIKQVFVKWHAANTFNTAFYQNLKDAANVIFYKYPQEKPPIFVKYEREFLQKYRNISRLEPTISLYESYALRRQGMRQLEKLQLQYSDLPKGSKNPEQKKSNAANLKVKVQDLIYKFMRSLKLNKKGAQVLIDLFQNQKACKDLFGEQKPAQPATGPHVNGQP